ncbi:MAG: ABC transporter ATP-binding protein [Armatimonadetes bacterium]|nr:ABC transporter ATP-binding protein [Armatimonadota bacterium]
MSVDVRHEALQTVTKPLQVEERRQGAPILAVKKLRTCFDTYRGQVRAVDGISLSVRPGETVALVGESGCGKSAAALSIMRLVPPPGRITGGQVIFDGQDLLALSRAEMRRIRGRRIAMVFQDPLTALNPTLRVGAQLVETLATQGAARGRAARQRAVALLDAVGIPAAAERMRAYPHELSGGMRQRVVIAMAIAGQPDLVIADEPTTALDVTLQAQIMELLAKLKEERGLAILLITHDLGIVANFADRAAVMYAGQIVAEGPVADLVREPLHPYARGLLRCVPRLGRPDVPIHPIHGSVPDMVAPPAGCRFAPRCPEAMPQCRQEMPVLKRQPPTARTIRQNSEGESLARGGTVRRVRCHLHPGEGGNGR